MRNIYTAKQKHRETEGKRAPVGPGQESDVMWFQSLSYKLHDPLRSFQKQKQRPFLRVIEENRKKYPVKISVIERSTVRSEKDRYLTLFCKHFVSLKRVTGSVMAHCVTHFAGQAAERNKWKISKIVHFFCRNFASQVYYSRSKFSRIKKSWCGHGRLRNWQATTFFQRCPVK